MRNFERYGAKRTSEFSEVWINLYLFFILNLKYLHDSLWQYCGLLEVLLYLCMCTVLISDVVLSWFQEHHYQWSSCRHDYQPGKMFFYNTNTRLFNLSAKKKHSVTYSQSYFPFIFQHIGGSIEQVMGVCQSFAQPLTQPLLHLSTT